MKYDGNELPDPRAGRVTDHDHGDGVGADNAVIVRGLGYLLGAVSLAMCVGLWVLAGRGGVGEAAPAWAWSWLPELGVSLAFRLDGLGLLFATLVTGIGSLVLVYAGHYMEHEEGGVRFLLTLFAFLLAMLGLVLADDLIALFLFWELTSVTSFLLIGHTRSEQARRGAMQALIVTGLGGVCLLAAAVLIRQVAGTTTLSDLVYIGGTLRESPLYGPIFVLLAAGCLSKSAQFPLHFWLPGSMAAPTPASAFLHSATMVKAGIYLLLRLEPSLGGTTLWTVTLVGSGGVTMLLGAAGGLVRQDIKAILAYSTLSQLGALTLLLGIGGEMGRSAAVVGIVAHAAYKSALFLAGGIVAHAVGTRDLREIPALSPAGGLRRAMPITAALTAVAAVSMAGVPPTAGFVGKEMLLAAGRGVGGAGGYLVVGAVVVSGALLLAMAGRLWVRVFASSGLTGAGLGGAESRSPNHGTDQRRPHDPHLAMWLAVAVPAVAGLALPWMSVLSPLLTSAAGAVSRPVSLFPWHGLSVELVLSAVTIALGVLVFGVLRKGVGAVQEVLAEWSPASGLYERGVAGLDRVARWATRMQTGQLQTYLLVMLVGVGAMGVALGGVTWPGWGTGGGGGRGTSEAFTWVLRVFALGLVVVSSVASVVLKRDLYAILALGASGLAMVLLFALEPAPDVALVMVVVDILSVVILILAAVRVPAAQRAEAGERERRSRRPWLHMGVCAVAGGLVSLLAFQMLESRPRESRVTPHYEAAAKPLTGADDIVGAIVLDFRGFDTLIEITVFSLAGLGVWALLGRRGGGEGEVEAGGAGMAGVASASEMLGIGGPRSSAMLRTVGGALLPLCLVVAAVHLMYGHHQPGDGFTAGVIAAIGVAAQFVLLGNEAARRTLRWLAPTALIGGGLLLVLGVQWLSGLIHAGPGETVPVQVGGGGGGAEAFGSQGGYFAPTDFGVWLGIAGFLPPGFSLSNAFLFDLAVFLTVLGSASLMIGSLVRRESDEGAEALKVAGPEVLR